MAVRTGIVALMIVAGTAGCSSARKFLAIRDTEADKAEATKPIHNPFGAYYSGSQSDANSTMILRTKKGDRAVEVELPKSTQEQTDFVIPVSPAFRDGRSPASDGSPDGSAGVDDRYRERKPSYTDREIATTFPKGAPEDEGRRREVEDGLGLIQSEDDVPERDQSYLAAVDHVKQLYRSSRYEAALIELDDLLRQFQTDAKLHEMRGTLLDRIGKSELALRSWNQALRLNPKNQALRRFIERREKKRGLAGQ